MDRAVVRRGVVVDHVDVVGVLQLVDERGPHGHPVVLEEAGVVVVVVQLEAVAAVDAGDPEGAWWVSGGAWTVEGGRVSFAMAEERRGGMRFSSLSRCYYLPVCAIFVRLVRAFLFGHAFLAQHGVVVHVERCTYPVSRPLPSREESLGQRKRR